MTTKIDQRLRRLEAGSSRHNPGHGDVHIVVVQPGQSEADAVASIGDPGPASLVVVVNPVPSGHFFDAEGRLVKDDDYLVEGVI